MSRRAHPNMNGEFGNSEFNQGTGEDNYYNYYGNDYQAQENFSYQANYDNINPQSETYNSSTAENSYNGSYVDTTTTSNYYGDNTNINPFNSANQNNYNYNQQATTSNISNFPKVNTSPVIHQPDNIGYGSQPSYGVKSDRSWMSAFSSGGFDNEPPLLEELGINFSHIKDKTLASLNPLRKLDASTLNDADLTGPLLFLFLFGTSLLLTGKIHFGYIYGVATLGWFSIFSILNLMTENGANFYLTASVLGYCLLPMVLLSAAAVLLKLRGGIGLVLGVTSVSWCTFSSSTYFVTAFGMQNQQILIAYPIFLLYSCFALMTIF